MPEGPEVLVIQEGLARLLSGKFISTFTFNSKSRYNNKAPDGFIKFSSDLANSTIQVMGIHAKGKFIWWEFSNGWHMWQTLGLSGGWFHHKKANSGLELSYVGEDGKPETLYYDDQRRFGTLKFIPPQDAKFETSAKLKTLGPDILGDQSTEFTLDTFKARLAKSSLGAKQVGMVIADQKVISGVGNYLRAEALYRAKISPFRLINTLTPADIAALYHAILWAAHGSYKAGGASIRHYSDIDNVKGTYEFQMQVYGRKKTPDGQDVKTDKLTGDTQTIYYCPDVQV